MTEVRTEVILVDAKGVARLLGIGISRARRLIGRELPRVTVPGCERRALCRVSDVRRLAGEPEPLPEGDGSARPRSGARVLRAPVRPSLER